MKIQLTSSTAARIFYLFARIYTICHITLKYKSHLRQKEIDAKRSKSNSLSIHAVLMSSFLESKVIAI